MLRRISGFATGRRSKWVVIALWVIVGFALFGFQPKLQEATTNENEAFLPESAESTEVNDLVEEEFAEGNEVDALVAYNRKGGLTAGDLELINDNALEIAGVRKADPAAKCSGKDVRGLLAVVDPFTGVVCGEDKLAGAEPAEEQAVPPAGRAAAGEAPPGAGVEIPPGAETQVPPAPPEPGELSCEEASKSVEPQPGQPKVVSDDCETAVLLVRTGADESDDIIDNVDYMREVVPSPEGDDGDPAAYVTGIAGIIADSIEVFESIDVTLLLVTVALVLVLLLAIYRSPVIALVPLFVVGIAYGIAAAATYGLVQAGIVEVNGQTTSLLIVLMFGAGTDYCLLIVARYREELRRYEDKHEAMAHATERTAPAILSAGGTVFFAMLILTLADFKATQTMGPVLALGIAIMLLVGLTLLPALLSALGRGAFWPAIPQHGSDQVRPLGIWRRVGHFVHDRPVFAILVSVVVLGAGALGNLQDRGIIDFGEGFRDPPESVDGQLLIEETLSGGQIAPTTILAPPSVSEDVSRAVEKVDGVDTVNPAGLSRNEELERIEVTLEYDPFSDEANDLVPELRSTAKDAAGGEEVLVGGTTAENFDTTETLRADAKIIVPLTLVLIFLILCVLLRALVAPLYLVATVVLSYAFAIGASTLIFTELFNQPDGDPGLPTFAFIFLVALGVDYNIFLISRIREEADYREVHDAVINGLEKTGGVITSAGLILAGTFAALMTLPLEVLFQIGFTVALGLLVDTFLVRSVLVPAIAFKLGDRNWWPGRRSTQPIGPPSDQ
jgi:putative drug exporter of the RND superfamily